MEWIKVTDKMPELPYIEVLICTKFKNSYTQSMGFWDGIIWRDYSCCNSPREVTHWMPLPENPKE